VTADPLGELAETMPSSPTAEQPEASASGSVPGYDLGERLGEGGMGEVRLGFDREIGREIALKRIRSGVSSAQTISRFLREARIQARLEHPAIVPVYTLGHDSDGNPYFTMKRLDGMTLADLLHTPPALHELLRTLIDVCRAVQFAHAHGVVHRDLKPANVMVGKFGEVYVLDWGIARIVSEADSVAKPGGITTLDGKTVAGALIGTPGYMAPEQIERAGQVTLAADVYAVGAMLFEVLAGEALHPIGIPAIAQTLSGVEGSPRKRAPGRVIPPELDELCVAALATDPLARPPIETIANGIQRYLDGDRDHERRRELAAIELQAARVALSVGDEAHRSDAMRAAGRALALDPKSHDAATLISSIMLQPPSQLSPRLAVVLAESDARVQRKQGRAAALALVAVVLFLGAVSIDGARDGGLLAGIAVYATFTAVLAWSASRRDVGRAEMWIVAAGNAMLAALLSRLFGSLIVTPVVTCIMAVSLTSYPQLMRHRRLVIAMLLVSWLAPVLLEQAGLIAETWKVEGDRIVSMSSILDIGGRTTSILLIGANVLAIVVIGMFASALAHARHAAQREVEIQAWHLRQLLPDR
jgi:hypothetical protein